MSDQQQPCQPRAFTRARRRKDIKLVRTKVFSVFAVRTKCPLPRQLLYRPEDMFAALSLDTEQAKLTSLEDRRERAGTDWVGEMPLTYGEVPFESLRAVFERIKHYGGLAEKSAEKSTSLTFYDLGHGGGGACLAAACLFPFSKVVGIELLEGLCQQSEEARARWARLLKSQQRIAAANSNGGDVSPTSDDAATTLVASRSATEIEFLQGSFLDFEGCRDWSDGDVVLANSVCFSASMMLDLSRLGERLRPGALFITSNTRLGSAKLKLLETVVLPTSWGEASFHIHQRIGSTQ